MKMSTDDLQRLKNLGRTQSEVAQKLGVDPGLISKALKNGETSNVKILDFLGLKKKKKRGLTQKI